MCPTPKTSPTAKTTLQPNEVVARLKGAATQWTDPSLRPNAVVAGWKGETELKGTMPRLRGFVPARSVSTRGRARDIKFAATRASTLTGRFKNSGFSGRTESSAPTRFYKKSVRAERQPSQSPSVTALAEGEPGGAVRTGEPRRGSMCQVSRQRSTGRSPSQSMGSQT